jgi:hypothetical protein
MISRCLIVPFCAIGVAVAIAACAPAATPPTEDYGMSPTDELGISPTEEVTDLFQADPDSLRPCGDFEAVRLLQTPGPTPVGVTSAPTPTLDVSPAPTQDHIGLPEDYASEYKLLFVFDRPDRKLVRAIYGNDIAAQHKAGEPFAYGSILLMISYTAKLDDAGQPVLDDQGHFIREKPITYHMMRKEEGYGKAYGDIRSGGSL